MIHRAECACIVSPQGSRASGPSFSRSALRRTPALRRTSASITRRPFFGPFASTTRRPRVFAPSVTTFLHPLVRVLSSPRPEFFDMFRSIPIHYLHIYGSGIIVSGREKGTANYEDGVEIRSTMANGAREPWREQQNRGRASNWHDGSRTPGRKRSDNATGRSGFAIRRASVKPNLTSRTTPLFGGSIANARQKRRPGPCAASDKVADDAQPCVAALATGSGSCARAAASNRTGDNGITAAS